MPCALYVVRMLCAQCQVFSDNLSTNHEKVLKDQGDRAEAIKRAVFGYDKQASTLKVFATP